MRIIIIPVFALLVTGSPVLAASFDCSKASSLVEKAICADSELSELDSALARAYKGALTAAANPAGLKAEQRSWIASRDQCKDAACLRSAYQMRVAALSPAPAVSASAGVTGTYQSKRGEILVQKLPNDRLKFALSATNGMNVGEVAGEAALNGSAARFVDAENDCNLSLSFGAGSLSVTQKGSCGMGLNVTGAGSYKLISQAPPKFDN